MTKKSLSILFSMAVASFLLVGCAPNVNQIWCPISYDTVKEECREATQNPDPVRWEAQAALQLGQNEVAIYQPPGDEKVQIIRGIGAHKVPAKYSYIYKDNERLLHSLAKFEFCPKTELDLAECDVTLDQVRLQGAVMAAFDYDVNFTVLVNEQTAPRLAKIGGHKALIDKLNRQFRGFMKNSPYDPKLYPQGKLDPLLLQHANAAIADWEYKDLIELKKVTIRSLTVSGYETKSQDLQNTQAENSASAFATQQAIACPYRDEQSRAYCMAIFIWSQKKEGNMPQPPIPAQGTPVPVTK